MNSKYSKYVEPLFETSGNGFAEWFGYYNYSPIDSSGTRLICNRGNSEKWIINSESKILIGFYDLNTGEWNEVGETRAWNWQQGSLAHWLPGVGNENKLIFNIERNGHLASKIVDVVTGDSRFIDFPIYAIMPSGKKSIAIDLERSYWCRAYHYECVANSEKDGRVLSGDGIFEVNLETNSWRVIIPIQEVINADYHPEFDFYKHWVEHIMISPSGQKIAFLHRFSSIRDVNHYFTRLFVANSDGSCLELVHGWLDYEWSHFGWKDDESFIVYTYDYGTKLLNHPNANNKNVVNLSKNLSMKVLLINRLRSLTPQWILTIRRNKKQYYQLYEKNETYYLKKVIHLPFSFIDGHPSFAQKGDVVITDTYPDSSKWRHLVAYCPRTGIGVELARFKEAHLLGNAACDLHPKVIEDGNRIVLDTTYQGKHSMIVLSVDWYALKKKLQRSEK